MAMSMYVLMSMFMSMPMSLALCTMGPCAAALLSDAMRSCDEMAINDHLRPDQAARRREP